MSELTNKQKIWLEEYFQCWNATEAARRAGYKSPRPSGYANMSKAYIRARIKKRLAESAMSADEVLARLANMARADMADFVALETRHGMLDLQKANELGLMSLVKKVSWTKSGTAVELYSAQEALNLLGKAHGLFRQRHEITGADGGPIETKDVSDSRGDILGALRRIAARGEAPGVDSQSDG